MSDEDETCPGCRAVRAAGKGISRHHGTSDERALWQAAATSHFDELERSGWVSRGEELLHDKEYMALVPGSRWHETCIEQDGAVYDEFWAPGWLDTLEDELFELTGLVEGHPDYMRVYALTLEAVRVLAADPLLYALATAGPAHTLRAWTREWLTRRNTAVEFR